MTFVKTKLLIEQMQPGQVVEVRLRGKEPLENVPRSVKDYGHEIISLKAENPSQSTDCTHRLIIKKLIFLLVLKNSLGPQLASISWDRCIR